MRPSRTINTRFFLGMVGSVVLVSIAVHVVHGIQVERNADALKALAEREADQQRYDNANRYYYLYLGYRKDDNDARIAWGKVIQKKADKSSRDQLRAIKIFEDVLRREPERHELRRELVDLIEKTGRASDEAKHLEYLLLGGIVMPGQSERIEKEFSPPYPEDGILEQKYAMCQAVMERDHHKAIRYWQQAIDHDPHHLLSYLQLAHDFLFEQRNSAEADRLMHEMVDKNGDRSDAHLAMARYVQGRAAALEGDRRQREQSAQFRADARKELEKALSLDNNSLEGLLLAAEFAREEKDLDKARAYLDQGIKHYPTEVGFYRSRAAIEMDSKNFTAAEEYLNKGLESLKGQPLTFEPQRNLLRYMLAILLLRREAFDKADNLMVQMSKTNAPEVLLQELGAREQMQKHQYAEAARKLELVRSKPDMQNLAPGQVQYLLGVCYENMAEPDRALLTFQAALSVNPRLEAAHSGAAAAFAALGKNDEATREYQSALNSDPTARLKIAQLAVYRTAGLPKDKQKWKEDVDPLLDDAATTNPDSTEIPIMRAQALLFQDRAAEAQTVLEKARAEHPNQIELWLALIRVCEVSGQQAKVDMILAEARKRLGDQVELRIAVARHLLKSGAKSIPAEVKALEDETEKFGKDEAKLLRGLADVYQQVGMLAEARRILGGLAAKSAEDIQVRLVLFDLALQTGDGDAQLELIGQIKKLEGDKGSMWRYGEACRILAKRQKGDHSASLDKARELLQSVEGMRPGWAAVSLRQAELNDLEGNQQAAFDKYRQALELGERSPLAVKRAVQILMERRQYLEAEKFLRNFEKIEASSNLGRYRAWVYSENGRYEEALMEARKPIEAGSKDPADYVWLGRIQNRAKKPKEAEETFNKAVCLPTADKSPDCWVAYVQFLAGQGNQEDLNKAAVIAEEANKRLDPDLRSVAVSQCYESIAEVAPRSEQAGWLKKAAAEYDAAFKKNPKDLSLLRNVADFQLRQGRPQMAEPYLRTIIAPETQAPMSDIIWARRGLALYLARSGNYTNFQRAIGMLEANIKEGQGSLEDRRTRALVLYYRPERRREAIKELEEIQGMQIPTPEERLLLAQLYSDVHESAKARNAFSALASQPNAKTDFIAICAMQLVQNDDLEDAQIFLTKLEARDSKSIDTYKVKIQLLKAQGAKDPKKIDKAIELVDQYSRTKDADLLLASAQLESLKAAGKAEDLLRRLVKESGTPEAKLALADFLGRQGRTDEALDQCAQVKKDVRIPVLTTHALLILEKNPSATPSQYQKVNSWIEPALAEDPYNTALLLHAALLKTMSQDYDAAKDLYQKIVAKDPSNFLALNNLGWLVTLHFEKLDQGLELVEKAIEFGGELPELLDTRGLVHIKRSEGRLAVNDLQKAIDVGPTATMYFHLAEADLRMNNRKGAVDNIRIAKGKMKLTANALHPLEQKDFTDLCKLLDE